MPFPAVDCNCERFGKLHYTYFFRLILSRQRVKEINIKETVAVSWINREITHAEGCEVLEEVGAL